MKLAEMLAREAIRRAVALYNRNGDAGEYDKNLELFHPDAEMVIHRGPTLKGACSIIEALRAGAAARDAGAPGNFQRHHLTTSLVEMTGEATARARHYIIVTTELGFDHTGVYDDEFVREGDRWMMSRRRAQLEWARPDSRFARWLGPAGAADAGGAP